ncbi:MULTISPECIES: hypothetical protein [Frankia]|uniref:Uncharacterized protein n=1 Tax=Frankia alni (strain DSM 45986 / CECT 9034 / ACN14a) TaxID=326424 RepID=Q0RM94_FRAAA|nr:MULTISPECIES: hypothetical protein [Frankia]CAJ61358.1 hypothetical protein FRAAL2712 [Frankia alni ACN14a]
MLSLPGAVATSVVPTAGLFIEELHHLPLEMAQLPKIAGACTAYTEQVEKLVEQRGGVAVALHQVLNRPHRLLPEEVTAALAQVDAYADLVRDVGYLYVESLTAGRAHLTDEQIVEAARLRTGQLDKVRALLLGGIGGTRSAEPAPEPVAA